MVAADRRAGKSLSGTFPSKRTRWRTGELDRATIKSSYNQPVAPASTRASSVWWSAILSNARNRVM